MAHRQAESEMHGESKERAKVVAEQLELQFRRFERSHQGAGRGLLDDEVGPCGEDGKMWMELCGLWLIEDDVGPEWGEYFEVQMYGQDNLVPAWRWGELAPAWRLDVLTPTRRVGVSTPAWRGDASTPAWRWGVSTPARGVDVMTPAWKVDELTPAWKWGVQTPA